MAVIIPNGNIEFYSGIRLDNTYQNALSFGTAAEREAFFNGTTHKVAAVTKESYTRVTGNTCDVEVEIHRMYGVNYMRFQNTGISNKWFYAFVTRVEYLNNASTRVTFELDVLTTFYFDWAYGYSFVERMHALTDKAGDNIIPENFSLGTLQPSFVQQAALGDMCLVLAQIRFADGSDFADGDKCGQMASPVKFHIYYMNPLGTQPDFQSFLGDLKYLWSQQYDSIIGVFMYPKDLLGTATDSGSGDGSQHWYNISRTLGTKDFTVNKPTSLNGYTPRNKKLLTYPYNYMLVNTQNASNQYRYERFSSQNCVLKMVGTLQCTPEVDLCPVNYNGVNNYVNISEKITIDSLPQVPLPIDSYKAWLAQTASSRKNKVITAAASGALGSALAGGKLGMEVGGLYGAAIGALGGGILGGITGAIGGNVNNMMKEAEAQDMQNKYSGRSVATNELAAGLLGFNVWQMALTAQDARIVDDYFDMFGYAQNRVMIPNIRSRAHWNYIKTNGLNMVNPNVPAEAIAKIKAIHDQGVTYWRNHEEIGNYALTNSIL